MSDTDISNAPAFDVSATTVSRLESPSRSAESKDGITIGSARAQLMILLLLVAVAIATRCQQFGNPIVHIDEQFYLLVGDRMLHGAIPFVDIWDRKPIGLFLIYAAIRLLGGAGILQYQLVATGFAVATAWIVRLIALRIAGARGATLAAVLYLLWLPLLTGQGGQAPVFYNLFVAAAALVMLGIGDKPFLIARLAACGTIAMGLIGIAIQIKYTAMFEGMYFGVMLLWQGWRRRIALPMLLLLAVGWVAAALAPTMLAGLVYWAMGDFSAFWYANFVSIFQRNGTAAGQLRNGASLSLYLAPLLVLAAQGAKLRWIGGGTAAGRFITGWLIVAIVAVMIFGFYSDHYGLPIVTPAAISAATALADFRRRRWPALVMAGAALGCLLLPTFNQRRRGTPAEFATLVTVLKPYAGRGLLVADRLPVLYYVLDAPMPTDHPFPDHLFGDWDDGATGISQVAEVARIMDKQPAAIVLTGARAHGPPRPEGPVRAPMALLRRRLATDYHQIAAIKVGMRNQLVYVRNGISPGG